MKVVSPTHRPPLTPRKYFWYSFLLEAELTPGPYCSRKDHANEKSQRHNWVSNPRSSPSIAEVNDKWRYTSSPPYIPLMAWSGIIFFPLQFSYLCLYMQRYLLIFGLFDYFYICRCISWFLVCSTTFIYADVFLDFWSVRLLLYTQMYFLIFGLFGYFYICRCFSWFLVCSTTFISADVFLDFWSVRLLLYLHFYRLICHLDRSDRKTRKKT